MKSGTLILIVVGVAVVLGGCQFVSARNTLAAEREDIKGQWSQVDADLQRRADLIPNIVETVKGRSEEHTSELQSQSNLVCRLLLEKKKKKKRTTAICETSIKHTRTCEC